MDLSEKLLRLKPEAMRVEEWHVRLELAALFFPDTPAGAFAAANLSVSTLLVGIGHLGDDRGANRARADRVLVSTSPLPATRGAKYSRTMMA
jgi:hypothetical protein